MLIEWLKKQDDFTEIEQQIAEVFLKDDSSWKNKSTRSLAQELFVSPSTITRFCQKAGYQGFLDFKEELFKENRLFINQIKDVNPNLPFELNDSPEQIAVKISKLEQDALQSSYELLDYSKQKEISTLVNSFSTICIYTRGDLGPLFSFKNKMIKIGKNVVLVNTPDQAYSYANFHAKKWLFILASYSGETPEIIRVAKLLARKEAKIIGLTSAGGNSLAQLTTTNLRIATGEKLTNNFGSYSSTISELFLLDLLYSYCFTNQFIENYKHKVQTANGYEQHRKSNNPLLND